MSFPAPDVGVARFPGPDVGIARFPGPDTAVETFPPAPTPVVFGVAEVVSDMAATAAVSEIPWRTVEIVDGSIVNGMALASVAIESSVTSDTTADVTVIRDVVDAPVVGESTASVVIGLAAMVNAAVSDGGSAATVTQISAVVIAEVDTVMDATASVAIQGYGTVEVADAGTASGVTIPSMIVVAGAIDEGTASADVTSYTPVGMLKSGSTTTASSGTLKQVTGMIADPAYPGSSVSLNALSIGQAKVDATIAMSVNCTNAFNTTVTVAAYKNGAPLGTALTRTGSSGTFIVSGTTTGTVAAGDLITLMCSAANGTTTINVADTFLRVT